MLEAQRNLFETEDALTLSERDVAANLVALYKALGGGWQTEVEASAAEKPMTSHDWSTADLPVEPTPPPVDAPADQP